MIHSGGISTLDGDASDALGAMLKPGTPGADLRSVTVEEKDGVVRYEMEVEGNFYRAEKLPLYHDGENTTPGPGQLLGNLDITPEFDTVPDAEPVSEQPDSWHNIVIDEDEDRIVFHGRFERGSLVMVCLEGDQSSHHYFINTAAVSHLAMCSGVFLETDERDIKKNISKNGLSGKLAIKVIIDDKKYDTGVTIFCD